MLSETIFSSPPLHKSPTKPAIPPDPSGTFSRNAPYYAVPIVYPPGRQPAFYAPDVAAKKYHTIRNIVLFAPLNPNDQTLNMELRDFIEQYLLYSRIAVTEIHEKAPFEFAIAFADDQQCRNWYIKQRFKDLRMDADQFCCLEFALWHLEDITQKVRNNERPSPEKFVIYWKDFRAFGIQHPSQKFCVPVSYCPWCGKRLPQFDYYTQYHDEEEQ